VDVVVRQLRSVINYGYEYIGPMPRVVITPLTDRVWLTITASLNIKLGCSLGGPAGTGKTETTKDLAKFFGFQCIVFNCSEQIDYKILGNIFSGLAKHKNGAYTCLDEFNRINVEVLSVVAQQLLNIRLALLSQKPGELVSVTILDKIEMIGKLGIFITMNPTYAGRTELPDNLKSLFRPITMMVPDFQIISKVKLSSEGFKYYDKLAEKLDQLYKLASQQLSQQDHYDFTLRTLGSVLAIAGNLKRLAVDDSLKEEETILIRALRQANIPKFLPDDILMFNALISDLFPGSEVQDQNFDDLREEIKLCLKAKGLEDSDFLINKCIQLFDIVTIRLGVCLIGSAGTGKTTCYEVLEDAMTNLRKKGNPDPRYKDVKHWTMNPKSVTMGELYGMENEETRAFIFGIMTKKIKKALADEGEHNNRWVVLDGPIDTKWIENLNSV
jgi:dynein heavy chain